MKPRARARFSAVSVSPVAPQATGTPGEQQRLGEMPSHQLEVVRDDDDRAAFAVPALDQRHQVADGLGVDGVERLVEQDQLGVLHQHARKQRPLQLAARQRVDRPLLETGEADGRRAPRRHRRAVGRREAAEQAAPRPQAEAPRGPTTRAGKLRSSLRLLRQVGERRARRWREHAPGHRLQYADDALHQASICPAPLGPTSAVSEPRRQRRR